MQYLGWVDYIVQCTQSGQSAFAEVVQIVPYLPKRWASSTIIRLVFGIEILVMQIGVTTGYLTKLLSGKNTLDQYQAEPLPVIATFILFIAVSILSSPRCP